MELLTIRGDWKNPSVIFNPDGKLQIWGRSLPENALDTYNPIFKWLDIYKQKQINTRYIGSYQNKSDHDELKVNLTN